MRMNISDGPLKESGSFPGGISSVVVGREVRFCFALPRSALVAEWGMITRLLLTSVVGEELQSINLLACAALDTDDEVATGDVEGALFIAIDVQPRSGTYFLADKIFALWMSADKTNAK
jgi:hypothetical protein